MKPLKRLDLLALSNTPLKWGVNESHGWVAVVLLSLFLVASHAVAAQPPPTSAALPGFAPAARVATSPDTNAASASPAILHPPSVEDIRDIRPPIHIPNHLLWALCIGGGLAAAGIVFGIWYWLTHRVHRMALWERALEQLEKTRGLMKPEHGYLFSIAVSEIVRVYIEERFQARAAHRTTEEFLHDLLNADLNPLAAYRPLLADFLEHCDLAKFARWQLSVPEMEAMHASACKFVRETGQPTHTTARPAENRAPRTENQTVATAA